MANGLGGMPRKATLSANPMWVEGNFELAELNKAYSLMADVRAGRARVECR